MDRLKGKLAIITVAAMGLGRAIAIRMAEDGVVRLMSKNDALIYAPDNIRLNSIHPGFI